MPASASSSKGRTSPRKRREDGGQLSFWEPVQAPAGPEAAAAPRSRRRQAAPASIKVLDPEVSGLVGNEILEGRLQPAAWAMALASSSGSHDEAVSHYARLRLQSLATENQFRKKKLEALESRRSSGFQKLPPEPPVAGRVNQRRERLDLHPFWLASMWLAVSGACASAVRLFLSDSSLFIAHAGVAPHIALGAAIVCLAFMVHLVIPSARALVRALLPVGTCAMAVASFSFGFMILQKAMFSDSRNHPVSASTGLAPVKGSPPMGASGNQADASAEHPSMDQRVSKTLVTAP